MTVLTSEKSLKKRKLRHAEYYDMTAITDKLFADSKAGKVFDSLMDFISAEENIKLAYRNIKRNKGSKTPGVDGLTIAAVEKWPEDKLINTIKAKLAWYKPKAVKRKEIPA